VPQNADLIKIVFASGTDRLNRALTEKIAATQAELPLYVVGEFEPEAGYSVHWIPWHVLRSFRENLAAVRAAVGSKRVRVAGMLLAPGVPLAKMRMAAWIVARAALIPYDEDLRKVQGLGWAGYWLRRLRVRAGSQRARHWLRRIAHPREAEIPVRARATQIYGLVASRLRGALQERAATGIQQLPAGVSIIVPSRDGGELLSEMLPSLVPQLDSAEVIVSDNGSTDGTAEWLERNYPEIRVIRSTEPLSFARAINAGLAVARYSHTLLLNNDMIVEPGFVRALRAAFECVPDLFCATAQIFFPPRVRREETGKAVWRLEHPLDFPVRCDEPVEGEDLTWVLYGSGGCSLFDTARLRELGGISEVFDPAYVEARLGVGVLRAGQGGASASRNDVTLLHRGATRRVRREQLSAFFDSCGGRTGFVPAFVAGCDTETAVENHGGKQRSAESAAKRSADRRRAASCERQAHRIRDYRARQRGRGGVSRPPWRRPGSSDRESLPSVPAVAWRGSAHVQPDETYGGISGSGVAGLL
jgi:hypothetical protein